NGSGWIEVEASVTVNADGYASIVAQVTHFTLFSVFEAPANWGTFTSSLLRGVNIATWIGGDYSRLTDLLTTGSSVWVAVSGKLIGYIQGAPSWVNATFTTQFPEGLPPGMPAIVALR